MRGQRAEPVRPVLLYIRHGDDHHGSLKGARYPRHDHPLNPEGKARAVRMARALVARYGVPDIVYCSPFKRARQTAGIMAGAIGVGGRDARIVIDPGLSRYFSRREQRDPSVGSGTRTAGPPPIYERSGEFGRRCRRQYERIVDMHFIGREDGARRRPVVVWCITHALVMRRVAKRVGLPVPDKHVPFLGWFGVRPRRALPAMCALAVHGLGYACPERALASPLSVSETADAPTADRRDPRRRREGKAGGATAPSTPSSGGAPSPRAASKGRGASDADRSRRTKQKARRDKRRRRRPLVRLGLGSTTPSA
jgi:broad specificity phosphatase PhoE